MQVAAFIITTPIDGAVGKAVASWFGHGITEDEETAEEFPKIFDLQPPPRKISEGLPVCPLCKKRTLWKAYYRYGLGIKGYSIVCSMCDAEWENIISKPTISSVFGTPAPSYLTTDDILVLRKTGNNAEAKVFLNKEIGFLRWKQMVGSFVAIVEPHWLKTKNPAQNVE